MKSAVDLGTLEDAASARTSREPVVATGARLLLAACLFASPWAFGAVRPWTWAALAVASVILLFLWVLAGVRAGTLRFAWSPLFLPGILVLGLGAIQLAGQLTLDRAATREAVLKGVTYFLIFFVVTQLVAASPPEVWRGACLSVTAFGFAMAVFALLQFFSGQGRIFWTVEAGGWTFGPYVNHNHYAGLMEMVIPVAAAYLLSRPRSLPGRPLLAFTLAVMIVSLLLSASRGGMVSLMGEILIFGLLFRQSAVPSAMRRLSEALPLGLVVVSLLFFWLDPGDVSDRLATVVKFVHPTDVGIVQRKVLAMDALRMVRDHPWIGTGLGSFGTVYTQYRSFPSDLAWEHAHNDYAEWLVEAGLVGGVLMLVALVIFFRLAFRDFAGRIRYGPGALQIGAALGCCGLLIHGLFDFNLRIPANAFWFAVLAAFATSRQARDEVEAIP